jgi:3-methyladenine DNA glycosylase AlkD
LKIPARLGAHTGASGAVAHDERTSTGPRMRAVTGRGQHGVRILATRAAEVGVVNPVEAIRHELRKLGDRERAKILRGFFKTGPGGYGEGDVFIGVTVPELRRLAKKHDLPVTAIRKLLRSPVHEERLLALFMLIRTYSKAAPDLKKRIYELYIANTRYINNWDLVDLSAHHIVGDYLKERSRKPLYRLAKSKSLWERRIAMLSTFRYIKENDFEDAVAVAEILLEDEEDLIHKAVGWMLREIGKRYIKTEEQFLKKHYKKMPRTMLRYAIERFPEPKRQRYLKGQV